MNELKALIMALRPASEEQTQEVPELTDEEWDRHQVERANSKPGNLTGYDCPKCRNRGYWLRYDESLKTIVQCTCDCMARRQSLRRIHQSGIGRAMERMSFDTYRTEEPWQKTIKQAAETYAADPEGWFFVGGQVGSGKTHICTAILQALSDRYPVRYMLWRDAVAKLKAGLNDPAGIALMDEYKNAPVLYIDDLFRGAVEPTQGDLNIAFELLNYRYNDDRLLTIISSERYSDEILAVDEGIGSRIVERACGYLLEVSRRNDRNHRIRR